MKKEELIEALKKNRTPFCYMDAGLQQAMLEFKGDIECLQSTSRLNNIVWSLIEKEVCDPDIHCYGTWRLRPDYEPEAETVECEIAHVLRRSK
jgi:hypothetical protein